MNKCPVQHSWLEVAQSSAPRNCRANSLPGALGWGTVSEGGSGHGCRAWLVLGSICPAPWFQLLVITLSPLLWGHVLSHPAVQHRISPPGQKWTRHLAPQRLARRWSATKAGHPLPFPGQRPRGRPFVGLEDGSSWTAGGGGGLSPRGTM